MNRLAWTGLVAVAATLGPSLAQATDAIVVSDIALEAGPDRTYPTVALLQSGTRVWLQGCTPDWTWCDVIAGADRGWLPTADLMYAYQDNWAILDAYGQKLGIPVENFAIASYWDGYYRYRPFYVERRTWYARSFPDHSQRVAVVTPPHPIFGPGGVPTTVAKPQAVEAPSPQPAHRPWTAPVSPGSSGQPNAGTAARPSSPGASAWHPNPGTSLSEHSRPVVASIPHAATSPPARPAAPPPPHVAPPPAPASHAAPPPPPASKPTVQSDPKPVRKTDRK